MRPGRISPLDKGREGSEDLEGEQNPGNSDES